MNSKYKQCAESSVVWKRIISRTAHLKLPPLPPTARYSLERLSAHALRVGFITEAYGRGVRDEDIMRHTRHRDLRTMRGYVRRAGLLTESPAAAIDL